MLRTRGSTSALAITSEFSIKTLGLNIRNRRKQLEVTQVQLAKRLGLTQGAIHQWESGSTQITVQNLFKLAEALRISVPDLLSCQKESIGKVDTAKLAQDIDYLESALGSKFAHLRPLQRAKLISYLYEHKGELDQSEVSRIYDLVS